MANPEFGRGSSRRKTKPKKSHAKPPRRKKRRKGGTGRTPYHLGKIKRKGYKLDKLWPLIIESLMNGRSVRQTCNDLSIEPQSYYNFKARNSKFKKEAEAAVLSRIEMVEDSLFEDCMRPKQVDAKKFYLTNRKPKSWANKIKEELHVKEIPQIVYEDAPSGKNKFKR